MATRPISLSSTADTGWRAGSATALAAMTARVAATGSTLSRSGSQRVITPTATSAPNRPAPPGWSQNRAAEPARNSAQQASWIRPGTR